MANQCEFIDPSWRTLYKGAILEMDRNKAATRIADAETAIVARARALFHQSSSSIEERKALDNALDVLHVLKHYCPKLAA
jgi:hypothetical protein